MGWFEDLMGGTTSPIGSASDVSMVNQQGFNDWMKQLQSMMSGYGSQLGTSTGNAQQGYAQLADMTSNYNNFVQGLLGGQGLYQSLAGATNNFDPNASLNSYLSQQTNLAQLANQNVNTALSDVYSTGRAQANAAANTARTQAAGDLASAGLLNSGAGVTSMTQATADQIMNMETNLAQLRSQAYQNQLSGLQSQSANLLNTGYSNAAQLAQAAQQLGLQGITGQAGVLEAAAGGQANLASLYGGLLGQTAGYGTQLNQPEYWQPTYQQNPGLLDYLNTAGTLLGGIGSLSTGGLSSLFSGLGNVSLGGNNYTPGGSQWAAGWRSQ